MEYNKPRLINNPPAFISPASPRCITGVTAKQALFFLGTWGFNEDAIQGGVGGLLVPLRVETAERSPPGWLASRMIPKKISNGDLPDAL